MSHPNSSSMRSVETGQDLILASLARLRTHASAAEPLAVLHLGDDVLALAWETPGQAAQIVFTPPGLQTLVDRHLSAEHVSALTVEQAIAEVEDAVMPWHKQLPNTAQLLTADVVVVTLARWASMPSDTGSWQFTTEAVEALFNRWVARVQGRPYREDPLPASGPLVAALLVLRECLHHLGLESITVVNLEPLSAPSN